MTDSKAKSNAEESPFVERKRCCTTCDFKKICHICGTNTLWACSDCQIDLDVTVYVCATTKCRDAHEDKCAARLREKLATAQSQLAGEVLKHIEAERLDGTADRGDVAYNQAIDDSLESVKRLFTRLGIMVEG